MKRNSILALLATLVVIASFGLVQAQTPAPLGDPDEAWLNIVTAAPDTIYTNDNFSLDLWIANANLEGAYTLGFIMYSPDGVVWSYRTDPSWYGSDPLSRGVTDKIVSVWNRQIGAFDGGYSPILVPNPLLGGSTGQEDSVLYGGVAVFAPGLPAGALDKLAAVEMTMGAVEGTWCADSVSLFPPAGQWVFGTGVAPSFAGTFCWDVYEIPNQPPTFTNCPGTQVLNHCNQYSINLTATDPEDNTPIAFDAVSSTGAGTFDVTPSGVLTYVPDNSDIGTTVTVCASATDALGAHSSGNDCCFDIQVTNTAPNVSCGLTDASENTVAKGNTFTKSDIVGSDPDACDNPVTYSLVSIVPANVGPADIDPISGVFTWDTDDPGDVGVHTVLIEVTDGFEVGRCQFDVEVLATEPFKVMIEKAHDVYQGHIVGLDITMESGSEPIGGYDFLIAYDASALSFLEAEPGDLLDRCNWEFFTYRYSWNGNCGSACPSGLLRVTALAETNNGPSHPGCFLANPGETLATIKFLVSNDRTLECQYVPVRFYWIDCGDNTMSSIGGDTLFINRFIWEFDAVQIPSNSIHDYGTILPSYQGAPDDPCLDGDKKYPVRFIDFVNGGFDIVCSDSIDARGDINVNGVAYEVADDVMLTNYFIEGLGAFGTHIEASVAASDVNADGIVLSVSDLVYLTRVIVGDANPYPKVVPGADMMTLKYTQTDGMLDVNYVSTTEAGAALIKLDVDGTVGVPVLGSGAENMDIKYGVDGSTVTILVYNIGHESISSGEGTLVSIPVNGEVKSVDADVADYFGNPMDVTTRSIPANLAVSNFPNPFNPSTTISLSLPQASEYSVKIYNVAGQLVQEFSGYHDAGTVEITWNGDDVTGSKVASGIYFMKANAQGKSLTRKLVLMK